MKLEKTQLPNLFTFSHDCFEDHRGSYEELYNKIAFDAACKNELGYTIDFVEDDIAVSTKHVLRGLHGDDRTWKYVTCLKGKYFINVLCYDKESEYFGQHVNFVLSEQNKLQLLIPPKHGHGYVVMSDDAIFHYKQSCNYKGMINQFEVKYDDPRFEMWWPVSNPILSKRDTFGLER